MKAKSHAKLHHHLKQAEKAHAKGMAHHEKAMTYAEQMKHEKKEVKLISKLAKMHKMPKASKKKK